MNITKILDFLTGRKVQDYYNEYIKTQWFSSEAMKDYQLDKFKKLVHHCYTNVPYYTELMNSTGFTPEDIHSLEDIKRFPILTKEIIKENYEKFYPSNIKKIKGVKTSQTGGTTGNILFKRNDANTRSSIWAAYRRFNDWMGYKEGDKALILMGGHVIGTSLKDQLKSKFYDILTNTISFNPYDTKNDNLDSIIKSLRYNKFKLIRSYSQFLYFLATKIKQMGEVFPVGAITTTAEPLMQEHRNLFKEVFLADTFDQYGCGEIGGIAFECDHHEGLHVTEERVYIEVNDNSEIIVTDLDNYAMPFIRYWNADQVELADSPCSCGRKSLLIKRVMGRTCDYIIGKNGEYLHWAYFWHLFFDSGIAKNNNLQKFQVVQESPDKIEINLICETISDELILVLKQNIQSRIGLVDIVFNYCTNIENTKTGKYRPVINKLI
jgi:phenylacetate-CoA ligase